MTLNSVNTNYGAMIALESLNRTNSALSDVQKQVSTGFRVADSTDDGAAYAVAQSVRSTVGALTTANQQLGNVQGLLSTTQSGLNDVSNTMASMRDVLVSLSDGATTGDQRTQYITQYNSLLANVKSDIQDAGYAGKTLVGNITGSNSFANFGHVATVRNDQGASYALQSFSGSALLASLTFTSTQLGGAGTVQGLISASGTFLNQQNAVGTALNTVGSEVNFVANQISYNSDKVDALNTGIGALVDANLAQESAQLQALQIRQQLGTQALSLANQAPQTLLSLFK
ncbi:MAG TPA: flagellin [Acetobacteraceae bacterium]|jgi:flagellin|nr:flagellin [Acetobacteraceae bacterium]